MHDLRFSFGGLGLGFKVVVEKKLLPKITALSPPPLSHNWRQHNGSVLVVGGGVVLWEGGLLCFLGNSLNL